MQVLYSLLYKSLHKNVSPYTNIFSQSWSGPYLDLNRNHIVECRFEKPHMGYAKA